MARTEDALELLLPDAEASVMSRARDVTHFLRLLSDDAQSARAASVGIDWDRARTELEQHDVQRLTRAISDLLRHHLNAVACGESFAWYGDAALGLQGAWRLVSEFRDEMPWLAGVPEPNECALDVASRLLESLGRLDVGEAEVSLWRARIARWTDGPLASEKLHRAVFERIVRSGESTRLEHRAQLERGDPRARAARTERRAPLEPGARPSHAARLAQSVEVRHGAQFARNEEPAPSAHFASRAELGPSARWTHGAQLGRSGALASNAPMSSDARWIRACIDGVASNLLDRGAARDARAWLAQHAAWLAGNARLRQLACWTKLVLGDFNGAKSALVGLRPWSGPLPRALVELRVHHPEWLPCLAGRAPDDERAHASPADERAFANERARGEAPIRSRADFGGALLCVFQFRPSRSTRTIVSDAAPALRESLSEWMREREDACAASTSPEHLLVVSARSIVLHRETVASLPGVLGRESTLALALVPILDAEGEVAGWLHMEFEHHLLPSSTRMAVMAAAWSGELARIASDARESISSRTIASERCGVSDDASSRDDDACADVFRRAVHELGIKTSQRRWWGFSVESDEPRLVITGGEALKLGETRGEQRALRRAMLTGGTVLFDEAAPKLSISAEACSGVVVPLSAGKRVCGLLAIESSRRRDFRASDLARYASIVEWAGLSLRLAQFRTWHRAEFGFDVWFDAARADFRRFARDFLAAARSRSVVVLHGPAGSGKLILTRWLHFESDACARPLRVFSCALGASRGGLRGMLDALRAGSLVLDDVEELAPELQEELLCWLEGVDSAHERTDANDVESDADADDAPDAPRSARIFATTRMGLGDALRAGKLRRDLAVRLDRIQLCVPALKERREDILPLIESLADRFAREEGIAAPAFTDEALALLWRQSWPGNVRELENVVYKLVLLHPMEGGARRPITPDDVARIAHSFAIELARKLNSRHPLRSDLIAALRATRTGGGRINKTRAAQFLGWDPDTLVARMQDLGIGDASALDAPAWLNESAQVNGSSSRANDVDLAAREVEHREGEGRDDAHPGDPEQRRVRDESGETRKQREPSEHREDEGRDAP